MAEETTQTAPDSGTPSSEPVANAGTPVDAGTAAKLQGSNGQAPAKEGSADAGEPGKAKAAEKPAKTPEAKPEPVKWDDSEAKWAESKGVKLDGLDPSNEAVKTLIKNARNAESEMNKHINAAKAAEIAKAAQNVPVPGQQPQTRKTEIERFDEAHNTILENVLYGFGVADAEDLAAKFPEVAQRFDRIYLRGHQQAWEREQIALREVESQKAKQEQDRAKFKEETKRADSAMAENLASLKSSDPKIQDTMKSAGVYDVLDKIEKDAAWPVSFVLSNPKLTEWFAKAAKAIQTVENMDGLKDNWRKEYEADLKKQEAAKLTPGSKEGSSARASIVSNLQKTAYQNGF